MNTSRLKTTVERILAPTGVKINGSRAWDIRVHDERFYAHALLGGSIGFGESYMNGWWDCDEIDTCVTKIKQSGIDKNAALNFATLWGLIRARASRSGSRQHSYKIGEKHYDVGNDLFRGMLDERMIYSCGYWSQLEKGVEARTLDEAQLAKLNLIGRKLKLKPGMQVLDIGCGWGGLAKYLAETFQVRVVGVTVSKEQAVLARKNCAGLPVDIRVEDYRHLNNELFDRVVSVGMFEHVGPRYYRTYMKTVHSLLRDDGIFLLHTIGKNHSSTGTDPWINKYIFPGGVLPSIAQIGKATERVFVMEDWHNFGQDYDKTLMAWHQNFEKAWPSLRDKYDERFHRMWRYYLLICAAHFRSRQGQLWQIVWTKGKTQDRYCAER